MSRKQFRELAPPEAAHRIIGELELAGGVEEVPLEAARGRILAERIDATIDVPGFDRASKDGYAVRAADTFGADEGSPVRLPVVGSVHAGKEPGVGVEPGEAVEISTGAVLPPGSDAVVMVERTTSVDGAVEIETAVAPGDDVMVAGADIAAGTRALGPGTLVTPREIGLLSALGRESVPVRAAPVVGIVSTGDELVRPGETLRSQAGEIYDVNSYSLAAAIEDAGGEPVLYPHVGDAYGAMEETLREAAAECDLVLSSGSTSAGAVDVVYRVIEEQGELLLHGVAVKPGKPLLVGQIGEAAYVGLPGYPVSALTIFRTFVAPALRSAAGQPEPQTGTLAGEMAVDERYAEGRLRYMPVGLVEDAAGALLVYPVDKGSGATTSLVDADGVVEMPAETTVLEAGESVEVQLFSPDVRVPSLFGVGEDDPLFAVVLDEVVNPRFLPFGSREGLRRLRDGIPDIAVVAGPTQRSVESVTLGSWERDWGLIVPSGNPAGVSGLDELVDEGLRFVNRDQNAGLRASLDAAIETLADERETSRSELMDAITGYTVTTKGIESPARRVRAGKADVGLGIRATAAKLDLEFIPLGEQTVRVLANPQRRDKPGVRRVVEALSTLADRCRAFPGYQAG